MSLKDFFFKQAEKGLNTIPGVSQVFAFFNLVKNRKVVFRNTKAGFSDLTMSIACALHNFRVSLRHPVIKIHILDYFR